MIENRKQNRYSPETYLSVYDRLTQRPIGELANLSLEGAMFVTPGPIKKTTSFQCRVELTSTIMGRDEILFDADCLWCRKNVKANRWESGYKLTVTGVDAEIVPYLTLGFKLDGRDADRLPEVSTVEMENRRNSVRHDFNETLAIYEQDSYRQIGELADLSTTGIRLLTKEPIEQDRLLRCRVKLPVDVFQQEYLLLEAKCMWCRKGQDKMQFESGHRIVNITEQDEAILLHLLIHHAKTQAATRSMRVVR
jgi:hypothetical protein